MKLKDKYQQLKKMHPDIMIILLSGSFYVSYGMDALLLAHLFSYHIKDDKVGFPNVALNKVLDVLQQRHIHYIIMMKEDELTYKELDNAYFSVLEEAQICYNDQTMNTVLLERIRFLITKDRNNYIKIKEFIDEL